MIYRIKIVVVVTQKETTETEIDVTFNDKHHKMNKVINDKQTSSTVNNDFIHKEPYPPYSCIILTRQNQDHKIFMEYRKKATVANGTLCCFGGKREVGETSIQCIGRECLEELKWVPSNVNNVKFVCNFYVDNVLIARFFQCNEFENINIEKNNIIFEEGREGIWVDVNDNRISPWHQIALNDGWINKNIETYYFSKSDEEKASVEKLISSLPTTTTRIV